MHQRLHEHEAEPTLFLARLFPLPGSVVVDRDRETVTGERPFDINQMRGGLMRVLDRVRERSVVASSASKTSLFLAPTSSSHARRRARSMGTSSWARLQPKLPLIFWLRRWTAILPASFAVAE